MIGFWNHSPSIWVIPSVDRNDWSNRKYADRKEKNSGKNGATGSETYSSGKTEMNRRKSSNSIIFIFGYSS